MCLARALIPYTLGVVRTTFNTCDKAKGFLFLCSKMSESLKNSFMRCQWPWQPLPRDQ